MRASLLIFGFAFLAAGPAVSQTETVIKQPNGERVIVRTDESGTTVIQAKPDEAAKLPEPPGPDAHQNKVYEYTKENGKIELERKEQK